MNINFNDKSVLVTGGTGSLGRALVQAFAESGGRVDFQFNTNDALADELESKFKARAIKLNFLEDYELPFSEYDILINNAGINISKRITLEVSHEEWDKTLQTNLTTPFHLTRQCLPYMLQKGWGRIVNVSSIYGLVVTTKNLPYNVSKHGLSALTKSIAKEYGRFGITCNEICPGPVESELMDRIAKQKEIETGISPEDYFQSIRAMIPAGRFALPTEVAYLTLFLASEFADYINGVSVPLDGALLA